MRELNSTDVDFIREVYKLPEWGVKRISETLEVSQGTVNIIAASIGYKRRDLSVKKPRENWEEFWYAALYYESTKKAAEELGKSYQTVEYAIRQMSKIGEAGRLLLWNRYREKHGMPLFTKC